MVRVAIRDESQQRRDCVGVLFDVREIVQDAEQGDVLFLPIPGPDRFLQIGDGERSDVRLRQGLLCVVIDRPNTWDSPAASRRRCMTFPKATHISFGMH